MNLIFFVIQFFFSRSYNELLNLVQLGVAATECRQANEERQS